MKEKEHNKELLAMGSIIALVVALLGYGSTKLEYEQNVPQSTPIYATPESENE